MLIVFFLITGLIAMRLATNKGYSGALGFALGFLLSIIGIIVVAFLPERAPERAPRQRTKPKSKKKSKRTATVEDRVYSYPTPVVVDRAIDNLPKRRTTSKRTRARVQR